LRIADEAADVLDKTLAIRGVHDSVLVIKGLYRIREESRPERNIFSRSRRCRRWKGVVMACAAKD
jgi:hypothetical protein